MLARVESRWNPSAVVTARCLLVVSNRVSYRSFRSPGRIVPGRQGSVKLPTRTRTDILGTGCASLSVSVAQALQACAVRA